MSKNEAKYFYDPRQEAYLKALKKLAYRGGIISGNRCLLLAIESGQPLEPGQKKKFYGPKYNGSVKALEDSIWSMERIMRKNEWVAFLWAADNLGVERTHGKNSKDFPLYKRFFDLLCVPEKTCDFRAKVHDWANEDLKKIKNGIPTVSPSEDLVSNRQLESLPVLSVPVLIKRYEALLRKREK